ncbi:MAG TPA: hypothetical protein VN310_15385 [Candidatus Dormibacteraeota bacterium]|jgi:hypothetical protein|nr:hypothetical protein [Candidatus Dormibacteraeota bacterium]
MSEPLQGAVDELESYLPELARQRASDAFVNDVYEAAHYWCELGRWVLENNTKVNYPERVRGERELLAKLQRGLQNKSAEEQLRYGRLLNTGGGILRIVGAVKPPRDGHLGFLRIVRACFQFLQLDYGFSIADEQPTSIRFSTGAVYVKLEYSRDPWSSCLFGPEAPEPKHFSIADLLFLNHDERYRSLPEKIAVATESEVETWFKFVADVFRQYGRAALRNEPGVFERLVEAQAARDEEYRLKMEKLHG